VTQEALRIGAEWRLVEHQVRVVSDGRPAAARAAWQSRPHLLIEQKDELIHGYRKKKHESLAGGQFTIEEGRVEFVDDHTVQVDGKRLTGEKILIATGARPIILDALRTRS